MNTLINRTLASLTGRVLVRADSLEALQRKAARKRRKPKPKGPKPLPADFDDEAKAIIEAARPWTMTGPEKMYSLVQTVRYVNKHGIVGDILECGVWRGGSMQIAARTLLALGDTSRELHLFDTFEGMPPPSERDTRRSDERAAAELLAEESRAESLVWAVATLEDVKHGMEQVGYPADRVHYVQGRVEETIPGQAPEQISILRLDTDWYESTKHELDHLYPRLSSGGVVMFDDYGYWEGAREAVDEWLDATGERLLLMRMGTGRLAVKP
jgi:hypothetical protein